MRILKIILLSASCLFVGALVGGILSWMVRGAWDEQFMLEGRFHVVSVLNEDHDVTLRFPSGRQVNFPLEKGSTEDFRVTGTGEGSVEVLVDGAPKGRVGYVTSMNTQIILVITENGVRVSRIYPSLDTEQFS